MTKHEIETELKELNNRLDKAEIYFKKLDHTDVDKTKEYKTLKKIIKRMAYLQGLLNVEVQNA
ncbi:hypothetical protein LIQ82_03540 [Intestinibacter bartlettii]|uniref:hypothetical protein n=1 Tax=Intestinibacter bartlettii TaxID=261299 RepID=UPI001D0179B5|nr:hypothetical protein [Intestinibacter bartlettii]MCB5745366.1 hypothetical protein [Intestinibacter bartlettii]